MEKKRTVYQMALSKTSQHGSLMPTPPTLQPLKVLHASSFLCAPQTPMSSALGALELWFLPTIIVPPLLCFVITGACLLGWEVSQRQK